MAEDEKQPKGKGAPIHSIISAQAGGISSAVLAVTAGTKLDAFKKIVLDHMQRYDTLAKSAQTIALKGTMDLVESWLKADTTYLMDAWKAGIGLDMGTAYMSLIESYTGYANLLSMYLTEKLDASIRPFIERYWRSTYPSNVPNSRTAFRMLMEGRLSRGEFNQFCLEEGWGATWHDKLYAIYDKDPDEYLAFSMYKRGLVKEEAMKRCFRIAGYDASWDTTLYKALHRKPSFRELTTLADYVPLPDLWVTEVLRAIGYEDTDINYIAPAIKMRPLREEIRSVLGRYAWEYQIGRLDKKTLISNIEKLGVLPKEKELWVLWCELRFADELIDYQTAIIEERVDKDDSTLIKATKEETIEAIKKELMNIGYLEEKANLMAELWWWEYQVT